MVIMSDGTGSHMSEKHEEFSQADKSEEIVKYGELVVLGYNGFLPPGDRGRRRSKYVLYRRSSANGVKRSKHYVVDTPDSSQAIHDTEQHSISYTLSGDQTVIVEYAPDEETDMFQIGRSSESPIDFVVIDTIPGDKRGESKVLRSTISRFACRILCDRANPRVAKIYAAGFDSSRNIFLGEKAAKWQENGEIDGLTTNGVLIMHPQGSFCGGEAKPGLWREVSVGGGVFSMRRLGEAHQKGLLVEDETNVLQDGTLIHLCGATLLWRSNEGLQKSPTKQHLEALVAELNAGRPECPVGLNTLVIPRKLNLSLNDGTVNEKQQPYVFLRCGHVQSNSKTRSCPVCLQMGYAAKVCMGIEPAFYVDAGPPTFAISPCGHIASEKTVKYWTNVGIPYGTDGLEAACPFCATRLIDYPGYVRLIFQDDMA